MMRDDHAFNINFVQLVKREGCLYDKSLPDYRNKDEHDKAWKKIAVEVNENVPHCKERWRNLRACLTRHLKNSRQQAADGNVNYKPYYLAEHMKFVLPYTKCRSQRENIFVTDEGTNLQCQKIELDEYVEEKISEPEIRTQAIAADKAPKKENTHSSRFTFVPPASSTPIGVKRPATQKEQESDVNIGNPPTEKKSCFSSEANDKVMDDADLTFFKSLLPDIRQMTPSQKRKFKMGIFELINNIVE